MRRHITIQLTNKHFILSFFFYLIPYTHSLTLILSISYVVDVHCYIYVVYQRCLDLSHVRESELSSLLTLESELQTRVRQLDGSLRGTQQQRQEAEDIRMNTTDRIEEQLQQQKKDDEEVNELKIERDRWKNRSNIAQNRASSLREDINQYKSQGKQQKQRSFMLSQTLSRAQYQLQQLSTQYSLLYATDEAMKEKKARLEKRQTETMQVCLTQYNIEPHSLVPLHFSLYNLSLLFMFSLLIPPHIHHILIFGCFLISFALHIVDVLLFSSILYLVLYDPVFIPSCYISLMCPYVFDLSVTYSL